MSKYLSTCARGALAVCSLAVSGAVSFIPTATQAAPITFATSADYDNSASQTTGVFRDVLNGSLINSGLDLGGTGHSALNFTGTDNNSAVLGRNTVYDLNVSTAAPTLFSGGISISADVLIHQFNNSKGAGIEFLFNEGTGKQGLSLSLWNAGNSDLNTVQLVQQTGETRPSAALSSVALGSGIAENVWYRLSLNLALTATNFTVTGTVFTHTTGTDPNSALGVQVGSTLTYSDLISASLFSPYEIGLVARGDSAVVDTSVTNFSFASLAGGTELGETPIPGALWLFGSILAGSAGVTGWRRKRKLAQSATLPA